eukprot:8914014-Alexandrium_andersonii.AAC.1
MFGHRGVHGTLGMFVDYQLYANVQRQVWLRPPCLRRRSCPGANTKCQVWLRPAAVAGAAAGAAGAAAGAGGAP